MTYEENGPIRNPIPFTERNRLDVSYNIETAWWEDMHLAIEDINIYIAWIKTA